MPEGSIRKLVLIAGLIGGLDRARKRRIIIIYELTKSDIMLSVERIEFSYEHAPKT